MSGSTIFNSKGEELFTSSNPAFATVHSTSSDTFNQTFPFKSGSTLFSSNGQELFTEENPAFLVVDGVANEVDLEEIRELIQPLLNGTIRSSGTLSLFSGNNQGVIYISPSFMGANEATNTRVDLGRSVSRFKDVYCQTIRPNIHSGLRWFTGVVNPEGTHSGEIGSMYLRTVENGSVLYIKESGTGNTGWVAK